MAEGIAKKIFEESNVEIQVSSAGISADFFSSSSKNAIETLKDLRIDISNHKSQPVTKKNIDENNFILTMTKHHKNFLIAKFPDAADKIFTLSYFACSDNYDIIDPFGGNLEIYKKCADEIYSLIKIIAVKIKNGGIKK